MQLNYLKAKQVPQKTIQNSNQTKQPTEKALAANP